MQFWDSKQSGVVAFSAALLVTAWTASVLAADAPQPLPAADPVTLGQLNAPADLAGAIAQAEIQRRAGDLTGATRTLSQLVLAAPDDPRVLGAYGKTMVAQGRSDDALAFLERAIELQPTDWMLYSAQGIAYDQKGNYKAAQDSYAKALSLKPGDPTVLSNSALSHMQAGDLDGAERLLLQAQPSGGGYPRIGQNLALVQGLKAHMHPLIDPAVTAEPTPQLQTPAPADQTAAQAPSMPAVPVPAAVTSAPLPPPAAKPDGFQPVPTATNPPRQLPGISGLLADPTIVVQKLPKDDKAGKVGAAQPAPKTKIAAKPPAKPANEKLAADKPAETLALRRTLSDSDKKPAAK